MSQLILHHYPPSPVSEKIRAALGLKKLDWMSVEENRLPDRPELLAMTGGYRRIPVLQVGADLYCDTQLIFRELEQRCPAPSFFPDGDDGLPFALSRWTDSTVFIECSVRLAFAPTVESLPPELVADRARLYLGPTGDFKKEQADMPHVIAQFKPQMGWIEKRLTSSGPYLHGEQPGMNDLLAWYIVWFAKGRYPDAGALFGEFPKINAWSDKMTAIGHGTFTEMSKSDALAIANDATPEPADPSQSNDAQNLIPGMDVAISAIGDSGEVPVKGAIRSVTMDSISLDIHHDTCGDVAVHFPRVGYRVTVA